MKRTKTVFRSNELAHVWANQGALLGRSPSNMRFDGDAFYSYQTAIANRVRFKGRVAYVIDTHGFSSSTSQHQSYVRSAIKDGDRVFSVRMGNRGQSLTFTPATLRDHYLTEYRSPVVHSRYRHIRAERLVHQASHLAAAIDVCRFFGLPHKKLLAEQDKIAADLSAAETIVQAKREALTQARDKRWAAQSARATANHQASVDRAVDAAKQAIASGKLPDNQGWLFGYDDRLLDSDLDLKAGIADLRIRRDAKKIQDWLAGDDVQPSYVWPTLLRMEGDEMVTTRGARVPLAAAQRTYAFIMARRKTGWHTNGEQHAIGMYQLEAVNDQGVVVGCHRVTWTEVDRFAGLMGWATAV